MKIVVGLGNPGAEYQKTRHNVGFLVVDELAKSFAGNWSEKFSAQVLKTQDALFAKPQTFMNDSGRAVRAIVDFYKVPLENLYVVHDDLDLEVGTYKIQFGKGPKIHNGLHSLYATLNSKEFWHVRIGVDGRGGMRSMPPKDYVLLPFSETEQETIHPVIQNVVKEVITKLQPPANDFTAIGSLFDTYKLDDKGGYITQEFQDFGYRLAMELNDETHKSLYMRLAKTENRALLEQALSFVTDAPKVKSKARLFMWKLQQLREAKQ